MRWCVLLAGLAAPCLLAQLSPGSWRTDLSKKSIDLSELKLGGPPKDGIPAIDEPVFISCRDASGWLHPKEPVLVVEHAGEARAYPLQILIWHELVNDQMGELPILVSYCPLCNSALVFDRRVDGRVYDFGVSGMLRRSDMVMYDRQTDSLWQQVTGEAIVGTMTGKALALLPSQTLAFATFCEVFPDGRVLSRHTGHERPYGKNPYVKYETRNGLERVVALTQAGRSKAYPFERLRRAGVLEDRLGSLRYVIFFEPETLTALDEQHIAQSRAVGTVGVFSPELEGRRLTFRRRDGRIVDKQTGSTWTVAGTATAGPLAGKRLTPVQHGVYFAFAWLAFYPGTQIVGVAGASDEAEPRDPR
jgi:hypothetical protein